MIKRLFLIVSSLLTITAFFACDQDHIFYKISQEVEATDPRIMGGPTAIVELGNALYSASKMGKTVHEYANDSWKRLPAPGGKILELATDTVSLFALIGEPMEPTRIMKYNGQAWEKVVDGDFETIKGAGDGTTGLIFASTKTTVSAYDGDGVEKKTMEPGKILMGAASLGGVYYLAVAEKGVFTYDGVDFSHNSETLALEAITGSTNKNTVGILVVGNEIVTVTRGGEILWGDSNKFQSAVSVGHYLTGAMSLWGTDQLLLIGIHQRSSTSTSTDLGYREIALKNGALPRDKDDPAKVKIINWYKPGASREQDDHSPSTLSNEDKYDSTIGIHVVTDIVQAKDSKGTLFAATARNGLWSYRSRDGSDVWNAEE
ncbi:MAG: hypothetical protein LBL06_04185 [Treponema sp.]|jgi:hypothetical protein|nr:hypothetical protein [Treponema sp.]